MDCEHGEPRGPRYCALCRKAGTIDLGKSRDPRAVGEARALANAPTEWRTNAEIALRYLAHTGEPFTVDDLITRIGLPRYSRPDANNAVGALIAAWARAGRIERVGYETATRDLSHGRTITKWRGRN